MKKILCLLSACLLLLAVTACKPSSDGELSVAPSTDWGTVESSAPSEAGGESGEQSVPTESEDESEEQAVPSESADDSGDLSAPSEESDEVSEPENIPGDDHMIKLADDLFEGGNFWGQNGEWLYYANKDGRLLGRVHLDGTNRQTYDNGGIASANVEHDRIYYVDANDGNHLYAMEHDGTGVTLLREEEVRSSYAFPLDFVNDRIYYEATCEIVDCAGNHSSIVYSVKTDGTDCQDHYGFAHSDGWMYSFVDYFKDRRIYRMRPGDSEKTVLSDVEIDCFVVEDDWIYYTIGFSDTVFRMRTDGTENQVFFEGNVELASTWTNIMFDEENVYLLAYNEEGSCRQLYAIKKDGSGRRKLSEKPVRELFYIYGDTVVYSAKTGEEWALYAVETDGTNERYICSSDSVGLSMLERAVWRIDSGLIYEYNGDLYFYSFEKVN